MKKTIIFIIILIAFVFLFFVENPSLSSRKSSLFLTQNKRELKPTLETSGHDILKGRDVEKMSMGFQNEWFDEKKISNSNSNSDINEVNFKNLPLEKIENKIREIDQLIVTENYIERSNKDILNLEERKEFMNLMSRRDQYYEEKIQRFLDKEKLK